MVIGVRPPVVFYNRANEAGAMLKPGDFDWKAIFAHGVRWFHSGGIFAALSATTGDLIVEAMQAAKAAGAVVSFDLNFRQKLWNVWGGGDRATAVVRRIVQNVDVLVGNEEDLQKGLGVDGAAEAVKTYPASEDRSHQLARSTLRQPAHLERRRRGSMARLITRPKAELDVYDRVGGGDGFAAGFFYGLLAGESPEDALKLGWAHGALLTTFPGDTTMATSIKCALSPKAARLESSAKCFWQLVLRTAF